MTLARLLTAGEFPTQAATSTTSCFAANKSVIADFRPFENRFGHGSMPARFRIFSTADRIAESLVSKNLGNTGAESGVSIPG